MALKTAPACGKRQVCNLQIANLEELTASWRRSCFRRSIIAQVIATVIAWIRALTMGSAGNHIELCLHKTVSRSGVQTRPQGNCAETLPMPTSSVDASLISKERQGSSMAAIDSKDDDFGQATVPQARTFRRQRAHEVRETFL